MGVIVQFNYDRWLARYPEFSQVPQPTAQEYFGEATLYLRNDGTGPVRDALRSELVCGRDQRHRSAVRIGCIG